jgi:maltooligosyltrehalose trehalohydrolase
MTAALRFGAEPSPEGVTFRLWAPAAARVELLLDHAHPMRALAGGWYESMIQGLRPGALYK